MEKNVGSTDKIVRIVLGAIVGLVSLAILGGAIPGSGVVSLVLGIVAIVLLATGLSGTCGLYAVLGMNTR
jgi:ABC-type multidrug transport system permease subunit